MVKAVIIGSGNVAQHLASAFLQSPDVELAQIYARNPAALGSLAQKVPVVADLSDLATADVYLLAVSDDAIPELSSQLPFEDRLVVHTSGNVAMAALSGKNKRGVFYPMQTFSRDRQLNFREIPIFIEADPGNLAVLRSIAGISDHIHEIDSTQRRSLHVAAVFVGNFTNHLYQIGSAICQEHGLAFDMLKPLIRETAQKVMTIPPREAQTGPAKRRDESTIASHLDALTDENQRKIYQILTQSIQHEQEL